MFFIWQTDCKAQKKPFLTSRVKFQETRFRRRPVQPISSAYATSKDSRLGRRPAQPISRCEGRGPSQASKNWRKANSAGQEQQQGPVCLLLGCLYKSLATCTPQCHIEVAGHREVQKRVGTSGFSRVLDTTTSHGTLASSASPTPMFSSSKHSQS